MTLFRNPGLRRLLRDLLRWGRRTAGAKDLPRDWFAGVRFDPARYRADMARPAPRKEYVIYFTARSGSSWLTEVLRATGRLGRAGEVFNPDFLPEMAQVCNAPTLAQYLDVIRRRQAPNGVWGCEVTWHQILAVFGTPEAFAGRFGQAGAVWLIRRDIVAQAVSLAKMVRSGVGHSVGHDAAARAAADAAFAYDGPEIARWLHHLCEAEDGCEALFARHGIAPLRLAYEDMIAAGPQAVADRIARHIGEPALPPGLTFAIAHDKLGTARNDAYAARFARENPRLLARIGRRRVTWLAGLAPLDNPPRKD